MTRALLVLFFLVGALTASRAQACERLASVSVQRFTGLPLDGSVAPRNTRIWALEPNARLVDASGETVATEVTSISVQGEAATLVTVLRPHASLTSSATYRVMNGAVAVSTFTVGADEDHEPPATPKATLVEVKGSYFGAYSCGNASLVTMKLEPVADFALMVAGAASDGMPATALALSGGETVTAFTLGEGVHHPRVIAFDLAGNRAESDAVSAEVPGRASGCSSTGVTAWVALAGLTLLRCIRRRSLTGLE